MPGIKGAKPRTMWYCIALFEYSPVTFNQNVFHIMRRRGGDVAYNVSNCTGAQ